MDTPGGGSPTSFPRPSPVAYRRGGPPTDTYPATYPTIRPRELSIETTNSLDGEKASTATGPSCYGTFVHAVQAAPLFRMDQRASSTPRANTAVWVGFRPAVADAAPGLEAMVPFKLDHPDQIEP